METLWHTKSVVDTLAALGSHEHGLASEVARVRLKEYGPNVLPEAKPDGYLLLFARQFQSPLIYLLIAASGVLYFIGEAADAVIILFVLLFNAVVGMVQEGKAQNTLRALKHFSETESTVLRDGKEIIIPDQELVPGDILVLQEGEKIPADARLMLARTLKVDESSLTGESVPVEKRAESVSAGAGLSDRHNMLFKGTTVVSGSGRAVAVAIGVSTEIGRVAMEIVSIDSEMPLRANIRALSRAIIIAVIGISLTVFILGLSNGNSLAAMFATAVSLAVSVIPEGLPIVITLVLASGVWRMSKRNALVKKLQAVEALGQAQVIAVDKTGTITKNELVIQKIWTPLHEFSVGGEGYEPAGDIRYEEHVVGAADYPDLLAAGNVATLCASAQVMYSEEEKRWRVSGDPTEAAMLVFGEKLGFDKQAAEAHAPLTEEIPFDYRRKYHATIHAAGKSGLLTVVGAPEAVFALCTRIVAEKGAVPLSAKRREELERVFARLSSQGLRVVAYATKERFSGALTPEAITGLTFGGFFGMKDGLRAEVMAAMQQTKAAGIRVVMITGDHVLTARSIATEAGIFHAGDEVATGVDIEAMPDAELAARLPRISVFARVTPEHKLRIIEAYKRRGEVIAMTGDGVNDAPSLVAADLGVAMGSVGTEVAKEAADIVLLDDNFGSIVAAIEEGRSIYVTIKKVILYLFSTSLGEVLTISVALLLGFPLPLLAAQIIWLNFVTDGFLDVALAMEPKEKGLLSGKFARPGRYLLDSGMLVRMAVMALPMMIGTLILFSGFIAEDMTKAWTISLTVLAVFQWFNAWNARSERASLFTHNPLRNPYLVGATGIVISLQLLAVYTPLLQSILHTTALSVAEWALIVAVAASVLVAEELRKALVRALRPAAEA